MADIDEIFDDNPVKKNNKQSLVDFQVEVSQRIKRDSVKDVETFITIESINSNVNWLVNLSDIKETAVLPEISKIGRAKKWFLGIANFRGQVSSVIDMEYLLNKKSMNNIAGAYALISNSHLNASYAMLWTSLGDMVSKDEFTLKNNAEKPKWIKNIWVDKNNKIWNELNIEEIINSDELSNIYNV